MNTEGPSIEDVRALERFIAKDGGGSLLLTFQGILRSHERMLAALSSPPTEAPSCSCGAPNPCSAEKIQASPHTDDVREALIDELTATVGWLKRTQNLIDADRVMRAINFIREVRPRGPVTEADVIETAIRMALRFDMNWSADSARSFAAQVAPGVQRRIEKWAGA